MDILKFLTAGSVDDGKSTLIGRLLYDSNSVLNDQLKSIGGSGMGNGKEINFALLTDGLRAEREEGITIDVAYKYFSTEKRKFIIADTPGHFQYTRNMITGASNSDLAVILIDARNGLNEQTKRHSIISSLMGLPHLVICINKMDLVDYSEKVFQEIADSMREFAAGLDFGEIYFIPVSAMLGDNVVEKSGNMKWYTGKTLLEYLENVEITFHENLGSRFTVQWVIRPRNGDHHDYRGYAGKIISGTFKKGDKVFIPDSAGNLLSTTIKNIEIFGKNTEEAFAPMSVIMHLSDDLDVQRGDLIVKCSEFSPVISRDFEAVLFWMDARTLSIGNKYILQHNSRVVKCIVTDIIYKIDVNSLEKKKSFNSAGLNELCAVKIKTANPLCFDEFKKNKANGSFILIDEHTNLTSGAGMFGLASASANYEMVI